MRGEIGGHRLRASAAKCPDRVELCPSVDLKSRHPLEALADKCKNHQNRGNTRMRGLAQSTFSTPPIDVGMDVARPTKVVQPVITACSTTKTLLRATKASSCFDDRVFEIRGVREIFARRQGMA